MSAGRANTPSADPVGEEGRLRPTQDSGMWGEPLPTEDWDRGGRRSRTATALALLVVLAAAVAILLVVIL